MWNISDFQDPAWTDPNTFLLTHKDKFSSLREFASSLSSFSETLKEKLTNIIHDDYTEFVSISKQLLQLGETMNSLIKDLNNAQNTVEKAEKTLQQNLQPFKTQSEKLHKVRRESAICQLALDSIENLQNVEKQLNSSNSSVFSFLDASIGLAIVKAKIVAIDQPALNLPISKEFERLTNLYKSKISVSFCSAISQRNKEELSIIFNAAILSSLDKELYKAFSNSFVQTKIEKELKQFTETAETNSSMILPRLVEIFGDEKGEIQFVISNSPPVFDFAAFSVWPFLSQWLLKNIRHPYGTISEVHAAYLMWTDFVVSFEKLCKSKKAIIDIRKSSTMSKLYSRLQLMVYPQLVSSELTAKLDKLYQSTVTVVDAPYYISILKDITGHIMSCFTEPYFIPEQAQDFVIIAMKIIIDFCSFAKQQTSHKSHYVLSLRCLSCFIREKIPEAFRKALEMPAKYLDDEAKKIEDAIVNKIINDTMQKLTYIQGLLLLNNGVPKEKSMLAPEVFKPYKNWAEREKNPLNSPEIAALIFDKILEKFNEESNNVIQTQRSRNQSIKLFNKNQNDLTQNVVKLKKQLLIDLDYFCETSKEFGINGKENSKYTEVYNFLNEEEKDE